MTDTLWMRCGNEKYLEVGHSLKNRLIAEGDTIDVHLTLDNDTPFAHDMSPLLLLGGATNLAKLTGDWKIPRPIGLAGQTPNDFAALSGRGIFQRKPPQGAFRFVLIEDGATVTGFSRLGIDMQTVSFTDPLQPDVTVPTCSENDRQAFAAALGTRPTVFAVDAKEVDVQMLCAAFKDAARTSHRLLMIVAGPDDSADLATAFTEHGLNVGSMTTGSLPAESDQIYLTESTEDAGLMYRLASMSILCGSFRGGALVTDPFFAASLGSALIIGPNLGLHKDKFRRLQTQNALRKVPHPDALGEAVNALLSVERAARMAHAGWEVTSQGSESLERLESLTRKHLLGMED